MDWLKEPNEKGQYLVAWKSALSGAEIISLWYYHEDNVWSENFTEPRKLHESQVVVGVVKVEFPKTTH